MSRVWLRINIAGKEMASEGQLYFCYIVVHLFDGCIVTIMCIMMCTDINTFVTNPEKRTMKGEVLVKKGNNLV